MLNAGIAMLIGAAAILLYRLVTWLPSGNKQIDASPYYRVQGSFARFTMRFVFPPLLVVGAFCVLFAWQLNRL